MSRTKTTGRKKDSDGAAQHAARVQSSSGAKANVSPVQMPPTKKKAAPTKKKAAQPKKVQNARSKTEPKNKQGVAPVAEDTPLTVATCLGYLEAEVAAHVSGTR